MLVGHPLYSARLVCPISSFVSCAHTTPHTITYAAHNTQRSRLLVPLERRNVDRSDSCIPTPRSTTPTDAKTSLFLFSFQRPILEPSRSKPGSPTVLRHLCALFQSSVSFSCCVFTSHVPQVLARGSYCRCCVDAAECVRRSATGG